MKVACYAATRNYYMNVFPSLKSLLRNGNVDRVYILAEDDDIGIDLPAKVIVKNVSHFPEIQQDPVAGLRHDRPRGPVSAVGSGPGRSVFCRGP